METNKIRTLSDLVDWINGCEEWPLSIEKIVEANNWELLTDDYGIARDGDWVAELNERGIAVEVYRPMEVPPVRPVKPNKKMPPTSIRLSPDVAAYMRKQCWSMSEYIERLIREDMKHGL